MIDYASELNESQLAAVQCCDAPSLVIAGAGSGKTRVLTYKVAYLIDSGMHPANILALTFTNKAAAEMRERIGQIVGADNARHLWMGTFHSVFARILRREVDELGMGYTRDYTIYDAQDSQNLIKTIIRDLGLDEKKYKASSVAGRIGEAKNKMITAERYAATPLLIKQDQQMQMGQTWRVYQHYDQRLKASNAMDFDDLLLNTYLLFRDHPEVLARWQERFQYVLVDEYQDTNHVQHSIVRQLTEDNHMVCVVGDDAQSIYSFRGAEIGNILGFRDMYPGTRVFKLERNYRSTQTIVSAAGSLIAKNRRQIEKQVYSRNEQGEPLDICEAYTDKEEASMVCGHVAKLRRQHPDFDWDQVAVLYRTNAQSRIFEEEFRRQSYPYRIVGGLSFYQRKEVKDAVAYMRLAVNQSDEVSFRRVINTPARGIGDTTIERITACAVANGVSSFAVASDPVGFELPVNSAMVQRLTQFATMMTTAADMAEERNAYQVAMWLTKESGLHASLMVGKDADSVSRQQNLQELMDGIAGFVGQAQEEGDEGSLSAYLQSISLVTDRDGQQDKDEPSITMMTVHSAKGLEFPYVFVVGMEDGLFPPDGMGRRVDIEEERRLFYVAMTRAERRLFLTWSNTRIRHGRFQENERSRFLSEIDPDYIRGERMRVRPLTRPANHFKPVSAVAHAASPAAPELRPGMRVFHSRFGEGEVLSTAGSGLDAKAVVKFDTAGVKTLLLYFAKLQVLE